MHFRRVAEMQVAQELMQGLLVIALPVELQLIPSHHNQEYAHLLAA